MALRLTCPNCGSRPHTEFWFGGELEGHAGEAPAAVRSRRRATPPWRPTSRASGCAGTATASSASAGSITPAAGGGIRRAATRSPTRFMSRADERSRAAPPGFDFEGRAISGDGGDSVASALYRAGVRIFSRSFKYHRKRGLYCLTGDCPNCLMTVDGEPAVRTCCTPAAGGAHGSCAAAAGRRPSHDALSILWRLRALPAGRLLLQDDDPAALALAARGAGHPESRRARAGRRATCRSRIASA